MPYGDQHRRKTTGQPITTIVPVHPQSVPPLPPSQTERHAGLDVWAHQTLSTDASTWPNGVAIVDFSKAADKIREFSILALDNDELFIKLGGPASDAVGGYDYRHPGGGVIGDRVEPFEVLYIFSPTGVPSSAVEVYGYAGTLAL